MMDTSREALIKELKVAAELLQIGKVDNWDGLAAEILQAVDMLEADAQEAGVYKEHAKLRLDQVGMELRLEIEALKAQQVAVPATDVEIYTAYITATNRTLRPQDERLALKFARAIEAHHGITQGDSNAHKVD